jgi:hypothetical protein
VTKVCLDLLAQAIWFKPSVLCAYSLCKLASNQSTSIVDDSEQLGAPSSVPAFSNGNRCV